MRFTIIDELAPDEVDESTTVYVNQQNLGTFTLDAAHPVGRIVAEVPRADRYEYALCGRATARDATGRVRQHDVNDSGIIDDVAGRTFSAYTSAYVSYYLLDVTPDRGAAAVETHTGRRCAAPVA